MGRHAYVGLSGPLLYDYEVQAERGPADLVSSPNPILDSPFGLLLLYDDIWFLTRSLCPQNMRELPYVHFLDEEAALPTLSDIDVEGPARRLSADPVMADLYSSVQSLFRRYDRVLRTLRIDWGDVPVSG